MTQRFASFHRAWRIARAALWLVSMAMAPAAYGQSVPQCTMSTTPATISFSAITVARDAPSGTALSEVVSTTTTVRCPFNDFVTGNSFYLQYLPLLSVSSVVPDVWQTSLPGIGVRVISVNYGNKVLSHISSGQWDSFAPNVTSPNPTTNNYSFTYQLIKTGQVTTSGTVSVPVVFNMISHNVPYNTSSSPLSQVGMGASQVTARSCTVTTPNIGVTLPTVVLSMLTPVGATAGETGFQIGLTCDAGSTVYLTLSDATTPGNQTDLLTLTAASTARNVQLRITRATGETISFGPDSPMAGTVNQILIGPSSTTSNIALRVRYISTGTVTPGTVNALATFTMSYQ